MLQGLGTSEKQDWGSNTGGLHKIRGGGEKPSSNYDSFSPIMKKTKSKSDAKVKTFA